MTVDLCRIRAVAASLRGIRERVDAHERRKRIGTRPPFDNAVGLLEDAIENADFSGHTLECEDLPAPTISSTSTA